MVTGKAEPWDSETPYFSVALLGAGLILGLVQPRRQLLHWCGVVLGQLAWQVAFLPLGPLMVVGVLFLLLWSLLALGGSALGSAIRWLASTLAPGRRDRGPSARRLPAGTATDDSSRGD